MIYARIITRDPKYKDRLKIVDRAIIKEDFGVAVKKGRREVLTFINKGLEKVMESGERKHLEDKWLGTVTTESTPSEIALIATPQEIVPAYLDNMARWDFDVILHNNTNSNIVLGPIYDSVYDTDTGFTAEWTHRGPEDDCSQR